MNDDNAIRIETLRPINDKITASETDSITERWEFGRALVEARVGKQLPKGLRASMAEQFGLEASEITRRMQLAERYATQAEVVDACTTYGGSWRQIIRKELVKKPQSEADDSWEKRAEIRVDRLVAEAVGMSGRQDYLARMLEKALLTLKQSADAQQAA